MITKEAERKTKTCNEEIEREMQSDCIPYREAIGSLLYLANGTRPDITYAVNVLSRKQSEPSITDWMKVKRVLRYLKGSKDLGLLYEGKDDCLLCYADASLGTNDEEGRSTSGYVVKLFGDVISWRTKKQTHVALSSAEAEFIAMSFACREIVCINEMCRRILKLDLMPILYEDNRAAIDLAKTDDAQSFKHIVKLCYHYIRLEVRNKNLLLEWIGSNEQLADFFTKSLPKTKFDYFRSYLIQNLILTNDSKTC